MIRLNIRRCASFCGRNRSGRYKLPGFQEGTNDVAGKPNDFILKDGCQYYLFCYDLPMVADPNVTLNSAADYESKFSLPEKIRSVCWLDNGDHVSFCQDGQDVIVKTEPYRYGRSLVVRVAKITVEK